MKTQINPVVAGVVIVVVLAVVGFFIWRGAGQSRGPGEGKMKSDLDMSKMEQDPAKHQKEIDDLLKRDREAHGQK